MDEGGGESESYPSTSFHRKEVGTMAAFLLPARYKQEMFVRYLRHFALLNDKILAVFFKPSFYLSAP